VQKFWKQVMQRYGSEDKYLTEVLKSFHEPDGVEILIVVDKLLVGFDEPRNTILYIDKPLKEHGLLQAIARVNRLSTGKDYGYLIDYRGVLGELNEAMQTYNALEAFDAEDVAGTVTNMQEVVDALPSLHDQVWAIFDPVSNKQDQEALERFLEPEDRRQTFYEALNGFTKAFKVALSMTAFYERTPEPLINSYKRDLVFFDHLRASIKLRYAETVDYGEYEQKIRKLLNDHIKAEGVKTLIAAVNIFDEIAFEAAVTGLSDGARADTIANHIKKTATERMDEDPAFYRKFSQLIEETLQDYKEGRISEAELLQRMESAAQDLRAGHDSGLPEALTQSPNATAFYGLLLEMLAPQEGAIGFSDTISELALTLSETIDGLKVRDWTTNPHRIDKMKGALEELLYPFFKGHHLAVSGNELDLIIDSLIDIAKKRESR
jgi:type I restriction enzyme R subunit